MIQTKKKANNKLVLFLLFLLGSTLTASAQTFTAEFFGGASWSIPTTLKIEQPGEELIKFRAHYRTRPWHGSPYYAYRVGYKNWSAELVHHKVYLQNPTLEIQHFEVSHGYNLVMISRIISLGQSPMTFRVGAGTVIGHPEGRIRDKDINPVKSFLGGGYHISGICLQAAVGPRLDVANHWFFRPEFKLTAAWAEMPLAGGGKARIPNVAVHTLFGFGYKSLR